MKATTISEVKDHLKKIESLDTLFYSEPLSRALKFIQAMGYDFAVDETAKSSLLEISKIKLVLFILIGLCTRSKYLIQFGFQCTTD